MSEKIHGRDRENRNRRKRRWMELQVKNAGKTSKPQEDRNKLSSDPEEYRDIDAAVRRLMSRSTGGATSLQEREDFSKIVKGEATREIDSMSEDEIKHQLLLRMYHRKKDRMSEEQRLKIEDRIQRKEAELSDKAYTLPDKRSPQSAKDKVKKSMDKITFKKRKKK